MFTSEIETTLGAIAPKLKDLETNDQRMIIAIAGPPAAGKSTFSEKLLEAIRTTLNAETELVPMDGFHYDNTILESRGHLARKGAPFTFDATGVVALVKRIRAGEDNIAYPVFDRVDDCAIANAGLVKKETKIILIEGNYLLLDEAPWSELAPLFDLTIMISAPLEHLEKRLIQRWIDHDHTPSAAQTRALSNDIPNARYVTENSRIADLIFASQNAY